MCHGFAIICYHFHIETGGGRLKMNRKLLCLGPPSWLASCWPGALDQGIDKLHDAWACHHLPSFPHWNRGGWLKMNCELVLPGPPSCPSSFLLLLLGPGQQGDRQIECLIGLPLFAIIFSIQIGRAGWRWTVSLSFLALPLALPPSSGLQRTWPRFFAKTALVTTTF